MGIHAVAAEAHGHFIVKQLKKKKNTHTHTRTHARTQKNATYPFFLSLLFNFSD
jgi:hypothetical protein